MGSTLYSLSGDVEKLIGLPVETNAGVWAMVFVGVEFIVVMHHKEIEDVVINVK